MTILDVIRSLFKSTNKNKKNGTTKEMTIKNRTSSKTSNNSGIIIAGIFIAIIFIYIMILSFEIDNINPIAVACPSYMGQGASWDITKTTGGYYVEGTFYSSTNEILVGYRSRAGSDCDLVY